MAMRGRRNRRPPVSPRPARLHRSQPARGRPDRRGCPVLGPRRHRLPRDAARAGLPAGAVRVGLGPRSGGAVAGGGIRVGAAGGGARGQHDHPAGGEEPLPLAVAESAPEAEGGGDGLSAGARARQGADPRALSQHRRAGAGIWGVEAASRRYFRPSARRLSDTQAAALAATLPFPLRLQSGVSAQPHAPAPGSDPPAHARRAGRGAAARRSR